MGQWQGKQKEKKEDGWIRLCGQWQTKNDKIKNGKVKAKDLEAALTKVFDVLSKCKTEYVTILTMENKWANKDSDPQEIIYMIPDDGTFVPNKEETKAKSPRKRPSFQTAEEPEAGYHR
jgi:hypothetical protein